MRLLISILVWVIALLLFQSLSLLALVVQLGRKVYRKESLSEYFFNLAIGEDQRGGSYLYGTEDWTISSYTYYLHSNGNIYATGFMYLIDFLPKIFGLQSNHCKESYMLEKQELTTGGAKQHDKENDNEYE